MATYTIIGGDQKQYPLVTPDDLIRWIAAGRANGQTLIKAEGETEFRPVSDYPEFAGALAAKAALAAAPPELAADSPVPVKTSGLAITSLVLGILGLFSCGTTAIIGLILGIVALVKVKKSSGALKGSGLALAGIIVSAVFVLLLPVFAAMVLPALAAAKQKAEAITCMNNVRQLSLAVRMYAADHQNQFPVATNWCDAIGSRVVTITMYRCPADVSGSRCSYAFNARLSGAESGSVGTNTVMIFETADSGWDVAGGPELLLDRSRHGRWVVVGFADGHVEQVPETELSQLRWNP